MFVGDHMHISTELTNTLVIVCGASWELDRKRWWFADPPKYEDSSMKDEDFVRVLILSTIFSSLVLEHFGKFLKRGQTRP